MKVLSFEPFYNSILSTFLRFPVTLLCAITGTIFTLELTGHKYTGSDWEHIAMTVYLSMLLTLSFALVAERRMFSTNQKLAGYVFCVVLAVIYFSFLNNKTEVYNGTQFLVLTIGLHLLVAVSPFITPGNMNGLWEFNKVLFLRFLLAFFYSMVIYTGLSLAFLSVEELFSFEITSRAYFNLWIIIMGIFNTWFFLGGIPENFTSLENKTDYPKGLKIFAVNVLIPLVTIYTLILYAYSIKILFTGELPLTWVAYMILIFSIFGILTFLLIYPLKEAADNKWVKWYAKGFFFILLPLTIVLFIAIFQRVNSYGITESRYYVILLASWLLFISIYFIFTSGKKIKVIPASLCIISVLSLFGPWSTYNVSEKSQVRQLTALLEKNQILVNGLVNTAKNHPVSDYDHDRIESILEYLTNTHGYTVVQPLFVNDLSEWLPVNEKFIFDTDHGTILKMMNLSSVYNDTNNQEEDFTETAALPYREFSSSTREMTMTSITGYDYLTEFNFGRYDNYSFLNNDTVKLTFNDVKNRLEFTYGSEKPVYIYTNDFLKNIYSFAPDHPAPEKLTLEGENDRIKLKVIFSGLQIIQKDSIYNFDSANGIFMIKIKEGISN